MTMTRFDDDDDMDNDDLLDDDFDDGMETPSKPSEADPSMTEVPSTSETKKEVKD